MSIALESLKSDKNGNIFDTEVYRNMGTIYQNIPAKNIQKILLENGNRKIRRSTQSQPSLG